MRASVPVLLLLAFSAVGVLAQTALTCEGQEMVCLIDRETSFVVTDNDMSTRVNTKVNTFSHYHEGYVVEAFRSGATICPDQLVLPLFLTENMWHPVTRIVLYGLSLVWMFLGIALVADRFMASIEVITAKEKVITYQNASGETQEITVLVWNETVANLSLMALGSSAPEIMLAVVETIGDLSKPPQEDGLGPSTIVGSAAFNLFIIIAICVVAIPAPEVRRIREIGVFGVTAFFSVFAYVWTIFVLQWNTKDVVDLWEALVTLFFFPFLLLVAYLQDKGHFFRCCNRNKSQEHRHRANTTGAWIAGTGGLGAGHVGLHQIGGRHVGGVLHEQGIELSEKKDLTDDEAKELADLTVRNILAAAPRRQSTIAHHHVATARRLGGGPRLKASQSASDRSLDVHGESKDELNPITIVDVKLDGEFEEDGVAHGEAKPTPEGEGAGAGAGVSSPTSAASSPRRKAPPVQEVEEPAIVTFDQQYYSVMENEGPVRLSVRRSGNIHSEVSVEYNTADGTALDEQDYVSSRGIVVFEAGQVEAAIEIDIVDDDDFYPDRQFYVGLHLPFNPRKTCVLGRYTVADITIVDDDTPGTFSFDKPNYNVSERAGHVEVCITRTNGADGTVTLKYATRDTTSGAQAGQDYTPVQGELVFAHTEVRKTISIEILADETKERNEEFNISFDIVGFGSPECAAKYGDYKQASVTITDDEEYAQVADKIAALVNKNLQQFKVGTNTWAEQFKQAMQVGDGDDDDGDEDEEPSTLDYFLHVGTFFWKLVFAFIPPTSFHGGWWAFVFSLFFIGLLTAIVGDLASLFGCSIGLTEAVTALTFVALGTSLPDTFASKTAAINDEHADASIGNVTGSNSVNVFLGLGLPWTIAALYHTAKDEDYIVPGGERLSFGVLVFCICATVAISTIYFRRWKAGGELGGSKCGQWSTVALFVTLWVTYVVLASLRAEGKI